MSASECVICGLSEEWSSVTSKEYTGPRAHRHSVPDPNETFLVCSDCEADTDALVSELYTRHGCGCCLHILTDDGNTEDESVEFVIRWSIDHGHSFCEMLGRRIKAMTLGEREGRFGNDEAVREAYADAKHRREQAARGVI